MTHQSSRISRFFVGFAAAAGMLALGAALVSAPVQQPLVTPAPSRWLGLTVTQTARDAYAHAMMQSGYEILPPVTLDDV